MRTLRPSGHPSSLPARGRRAAVTLLVAAVIATGCGRGGGEDVADEPSVVPGQPIDVSGRARLVLHDLSTHRTHLFPEGSEGDALVPADQQAIQDAANAVRDWLNEVLSERNRGLTTTVGRSEVDVAAVSGALGADGPAPDGAVETQIASAEYDIRIAYLGQPGWALARVESVLVPLDAPSTELERRIDTFVFTIDESGAVEFVALEVAP